MPTPKAILTKKDGRVIMSKPFDFLHSLLPNGVYIVRIERYAEKRTLSQNALMWLWFTCIEHSTGTDKGDVHDYYCSRFLERKASIKGQEVTIQGSTSSLNTLQMSDFMNKVQADAASEFGITLPLPEDKYYEGFINEYKNR
ncbi:hypothetical protein EZS27_009356 [termite gut metagenome]|uniref:Uncharacterized protein n=1 Tax=termite gut metagenome TaxID=433724 RepID=A0A5J4S9P5_9ZZZZ